MRTETRAKAISHRPARAEVAQAPGQLPSGGSVPATEIIPQARQAGATGSKRRAGLGSATASRRCVRSALNDHRRADGDLVEQLDNIPVVHAYAAIGGAGADRARPVRPVDGILAAGQNHGA